jgi:hypothetical protein
LLFIAFSSITALINKAMPYLAKAWPTVINHPCVATRIKDGPANAAQFANSSPQGQGNRGLAKQNIAKKGDSNPRHDAGDRPAIPFFLVVWAPPSNAAGHILAAAHRRLDFAVAVRAFRDLDLGAVFLLDGVIDQRRIAFGAGCVDRHAAFRTFVSCH